MKRRMVQVVKMRIKDAGMGDVVNRNPSERVGWFQVSEISMLFNGNIQLADATGNLTISGADYDIIGVQFVQEVDVPDQGDHTPAVDLPPEVTAPVATAPEQPPAKQWGDQALRTQ